MIHFKDAGSTGSRNVINVVIMGSATGGTGGTRPPNQKVGGDIMSCVPPPNHDGSAVAVIIPALKRFFSFQCTGFLWAPQFVYFTNHENFG